MSYNCIISKIPENKNNHTILAKKKKGLFWWFILQKLIFTFHKYLGEAIIPLDVNFNIALIHF